MADPIPFRKLVGTMCQPSHVFIVGLPRTGTTLTRNILNASDHAGLGGESMFFGDTRRLGLVRREGYRHKFARVGDLRTDAGVERIVDWIYRIEENNFWGNLARMVERDEFTKRLLATDRTERGLFDLALCYYAGEKPIRGEKTPAHVYAVPTLLEWFPNAKVIHTFRDPRAVYVSNKRKYERRRLPWLSALARKSRLLFELYSSLDIMLTWRRVLGLHQEYSQRYPGQYLMSRYEDLVLSPQGSIQRLCQFLDIPFQPSMLQQIVLNSSFVPNRDRSGFDTSAIDRWKQHLHPVVNRWFILWCRRRLVEFGYAL